MAITRSAARADGMALSFVPTVSRSVMVSGKRSQIRSSSVTTVAARGATSGVMFASPWTTSSRRRAARIGSASHCAPAVSPKFHGGPCVTVTGRTTHSTSPAHDAARSSSATSRETNRVNLAPGSASSSRGTSSRA